MNYYNVWVSSPQYKGEEPLTYSSTARYKIGQVVVVPFQSKTSLAIIDNLVSKPNFKTKEIITEVSKVTIPEHLLQLFKWLPTYYPSSKSSALQLLLPQSLINKGTNEPKNTTNKITSKPLPPLTQEQSEVINKIHGLDSSTVLIHGDAGTGKTRVYIELIREQIEAGKSSILLVPEIGLSSQLYKVLQHVFSNQVITMHSDLSPTIRRNNWLKILESKSPLVIVGPRSALFAPVNKLGIIVIDEAHESVYKQEQAPYYLSSRVAATLGKLSNAKLVLGTATPSLDDYYVLNSKGSVIVRMVQPAVKSEFTKAKVTITNLANKDEFTKSQWLSNDLIRSITKSLSDNEQSLIYLNRRGTAQVVLCDKCGWQALCPKCDTPLTFHADTYSLRCHSCVYKQTTPNFCPVCKNTDIIFRGAGTKAIFDELTKLFPSANIKRFDKDNKRSEKLVENIDDLISGKIDILVGTQIITKGFDLPKLSTVGVLLADSSLYFPDYTAEERTYQNIYQVIGRVGRGHKAGRVTLQTYHPESIAINAAINNDFKEFYENQLQERRAFSYPPFTYLLKISSTRSSAKNAENSLNRLVDDIKAKNYRVSISGPSPAYYEKLRGKYTWQIIVRSPKRDRLVQIARNLPNNYSFDIDPVNLL